MLGNLSVGLSSLSKKTLLILTLLKQTLVREVTVKTEGTPLIVGIVLTVVIVVTEVTVLTIVAIMKAYTFAAEPLILPYG